MSGIQRFLSKRGERKHQRSRSKAKESSDLVVRHHLRELFTSSDETSVPDKEEEKKLRQLEKRIASAGISGLKSEHIQYALRSSYANGDENKAYEFLLLLEDSIEGILREYSSDTKLLGAVNRMGVTCYLDAILFAMFARLDCFEAILYNSFDDEPRRKLAIILRLWVNLLRSGKLITTDITEYLQNSLSEAGWPEAAELAQQDASEAFTFITEKLELPLLTLKMDIYHTGKEDVADDHKFINERLLEVAIPPEHTDGTPITLEECLEAYFNNKIEVKRYMERRGTVGSVRSFDSTAKGGATHVEAVELGSATSSPIRTGSPRMDENFTLSPTTEERSFLPMQLRRPSIVQERFIPDNVRSDGTLPRNRRRKGSYRKEVMMPAWQFFSLIPWYTDNTPKNDAQVADHFSSKRPILGICLKRYSVLPNGHAIRLNTFIDIPIEIGLPHFIQDDKMDELGPLYGNFKLSLQSVVCHRGNSVDSGHYIALVRGTSSNAVPSASSSSDSHSLQGSDEPEFWMRFDDLAAERITLVNMEQALKEESPYLLFYRIVPVDDDSTETSARELPASLTDPDETNAPVSVHLPPSASRGESLSTFSKSGSTRPSFEITRPDTELSEYTLQGEKPQNVNFMDIPEKNIGDDNKEGLQPNTAVRPGASTPRTSFSFSRRGSRDPKSRSHSRGESGEKRLSAALNKFSIRMSREKMPEDSSVKVDDVDGTTGGLETVADGSTVTPTTEQPEDKEADTRGRDRESKHRGKQPQKNVHPTKERRHPDRECIVM